MVRGLILAVLAGLIAAFLTWTRPGDPSLYPATGRGIAVHVLDNGFHVDIAVPRALIAAREGPLGQAARDLAPGDWVLIGWGDARFYVDTSPIRDRLPDGARAFFRPGNPSVVMLDPDGRDPAARRIGRATLILSAEGAEAMLDRIEASLALENGRPQLAARRPGDDAVFLASRETFSVLHLCNHWAAEVLNAAGVPIRPVRAILSSEIMATVDRASPRPDDQGVSAP